MFENYWDKQLKQPRAKCVEFFGYVGELISDGIPDPVEYYKDYVKTMNEN
jgi:hypothetical protein